VFVITPKNEWGQNEGGDAPLILKVCYLKVATVCINPVVYLDIIRYNKIKKSRA